MRRANANVIAQARLSLDFFTIDAVIERDRILCRAIGIGEDEVHRFNRGSTAVKNDLFKQGDFARDLIRKAIPSLAARNRVAIHIDHQHILHLKNVKEKESLGVGLVLTGSDNRRHSFLCAYEPVANTKKPETVATVKQIAKERSKMRNGLSAYHSSVFSTSQIILAHYILIFNSC